MTARRSTARSWLQSLRPRAGRSWQEWRSRDERRATVRLLAEAVAAAPGFPGLPAPAIWTVRRVLRTDTDVTVAVFGTPDDGDLAVARMGRAGEASPALLRNSANLGVLLADDRLAALHPLLPTPLIDGRHGGRPYAVERLLPGASATSLLGRADALARTAPLAEQVTRALHAPTARATVVDEALLERWTGEPLRILGSALPPDSPYDVARAVATLRTRLAESLIGQPCAACRVHGDLWLGNLLLAEDRVAGIVDWDAAGDGLAAVDLLHLLFTTRALVDEVHFGVLVVEVLGGDDDAAPEAAGPARVGESLPGHPDGLRVATLLMWLGHVTAVLGKRTAGGTDRRWIDRNVHPVLGALSAVDRAEETAGR